MAASSLSNMAVPAALFPLFTSIIIHFSMVLSQESKPEFDIQTSDNSGVSVLHSLIDLVAGGRQLEDGELRRLYSLIDNFQAKIDVTQVGQVMGALGRQKRVNGLIATLEDDLLGATEEEHALKLALMDNDTKIKLLKILVDDRQKQIDYLASRASVPTLSGTDKMAGSLRPEASELPANKIMLPPEKRRRVLRIWDQLMDKASKVVDENGKEVSETKPVVDVSE